MTVRARDSSLASAGRFFEARARKLRGLAGRQPAPRDPGYVSPRQRCLDESVLRNVGRFGRSTAEVARAVRDDFGSVGVKQVKFSLWRLVASGDIAHGEDGWFRRSTSNRAA